MTALTYLVSPARTPLGPNTFWLDVHGLLMFLILIFGAFLFGAIFFSKDLDEKTVRRLKISGAGTFVALLLLMISGFIPDAGFGSGATFSGTATDSIGTVTGNISDAGLGNFTGPLLFDMMEHVSLIIPGLAAVVGVLIFHHGAKVITVPTIRRTVLTLMTVAGIWILVIGGIGVYITKILTYRTGS